MARPRGRNVLSTEDDGRLGAAAHAGNLAEPRTHNLGTHQGPTKKIFVGGLSHGTTDAMFRSYFEQFGDVEDAIVVLDVNGVGHGSREWGQENGRHDSARPGCYFLFFLFLTVVVQSTPNSGGSFTRGVVSVRAPFDVPAAHARPTFLTRRSKAYNAWTRF